MPAIAPAALPVKGPHLKLAMLLGLAGLLSTLALWPYLLVLMPQKLAALPLPLPVVVAAQTIQAGVMCWLLAWLGLSLGAPHGLDAPWLRSRVYRRPLDPGRPARWGLAMSLGAGAAVLVLGLSLLGPTLPAEHATSAAGWAWRGALASFYGGIVEEVGCRLLLVSLFVWLLARSHRNVALPWMFVVAIVLAALLFGAGHLPAVFAITATPASLLIGKIVLLNAVVGTVTGVLFWKYGLEHAMLAHFCADLVLHVIAPLAGGA
ncbi:CPBP family intramembrane metalloprotease [Rhodanobacter sp. FDAARGOS 1247]|uniref:CPBP family intramembrane glutamic endopeptidase n=1 Tax=Rhodanobacter sp. FDAARGOS 1247 TaxID=2778082 RepID=UPI0019529947|nr:CPBP family intramembrane glutamic endopeptidase [Rhodanobacter sp. FDAARGOS 1247]QRP62800.1 CPBP family intramembrane metalloprotease [Rhodanobacter sp. FDAARGOS 1247]